MATTDADPFEEFDRLYKPLDDDYAIVRRDMSVLIEDLDQACLRASEQLSLIAQQCTNDEAKLNCDQSIRQMRQLVEKLNVANAAVEAHAVKCQATAKLFRQWRDHIQGQLAKVERLSRLSTEDRGISREFSVAFSPRDATWDYFAALPALSLFHVIGKFVDLMSSLAGQPATPRPSVIMGVSTLIAANADNVIDQATFNFGSALLGAANATFCQETLVRRNPITISQESFQQIREFKRASERLGSQTFLVEAVVKIAEAGVAHAIDDTNTIAKLATARFRTLLKLNSPQLF